MKGIGNGISMLIAAGIIARLPHQFTSAWQTMVGESATAAGIGSFAIYLICYLLIIVFVVLDANSRA